MTADMADTNAHPIYALPLSTSSYLASKTHGKRKRGQVVEHRDEEESRSDCNTEYSAVITPDERAQRRLAGQPLDRPPPPAPFPHASYSRAPSISEANHTDTPGCLAPLDVGSPSSIRSHHVGVMIAILHKSLERHDYLRATKAVAVLLRTEILGRTIDLRHAGLWGIGAEILTREGGATAGNRVSRRGFEKAKILYDKLALQYPWHRSWPNVINAQDFKIAMFDLWIYTVCIESKRVEQQHLDHDDASLIPQYELQAKRWELGEADIISKEMDSLMATVPFVDHLELLRLRAMVALWIADLVDTMDLLAMDIESNNSLQETVPQELWPDNIENYSDSSTRTPNEKAIVARSLAKTLFVKLGIDDRDGTIAEGQIEFDTDMVA